MIVPGRLPVSEQVSSDDSATYLACPECDLLVRLQPLNVGERAKCPRCGASLASAPRDGLRRSLAFALAASVLLIVANVFPFLSFRASGLEQVMTLPQSAGVLYDQGNVLLAGFVLAFVTLAPALLTFCLIALLTPLVSGRKVSRLPLLGRAISHIGTWSMVEVFLIGVLVSFIKIAAMATVVFGMSFWAFVGFAICLTAALAALDQHQLWSAIEGAEP